MRVLKILLFITFVALGLYALRHLTRNPRTVNATQPAPSINDVDQACAVLGLQLDTLDKVAVIDTHKRLMQRVHPDKGGSVVLAQQLNEAKRVLLTHLNAN